MTYSRQTNKKPRVQLKTCVLAIRVGAIIACSAFSVHAYSMQPSQKEKPSQEQKTFLKVEQFESEPSKLEPFVGTWKPIHPVTGVYDERFWSELGKPITISSNGTFEGHPYANKILAVYKFVQCAPGVDSCGFFNTYSELLDKQFGWKEYKVRYQFRGKVLEIVKPDPDSEKVFYSFYPSQLMSDQTGNSSFEKSVAKGSLPVLTFPTPSKEMLALVAGQWKRSDVGKIYTFHESGILEEQQFSSEGMLMAKSENRIISMTGKAQCPPGIKACGTMTIVHFGHNMRREDQSTYKITRKSLMLGSDKYLRAKSEPQIDESGTASENIAAPEQSETSGSDFGSKTIPESAFGKKLF